MEKSELFGVPVALGGREELLSEVLVLLDTGGSVATVNATMLEHARTHPSFRHTLSDMSVCIPDGQGVVRALRSRGRRTDALAGVELGLLILAARHGLRLALYGAKPGGAERAAEAILTLSPTTEIVYVRDGYRHTPFEVARDLSALCPDLVYLCLGSPKQEEIAKMLSHILPRALIIGLGGSFDVWSGEKKRAPLKMQQLGLEWLWRMVREPRRMLKLPMLLSFSLHAFLEEVHTKSTKTQRKSIRGRK